MQLTLTELSVLVRLCVGALATFCAILLWAKTRDVAWVLVVTGVLVAYGAIIFDALATFGLVVWEEQRVLGLPAGLLTRMALDNLPSLLYSAAFLLMVARQRLR
jgi:hypothetical protein